MKKNILILCASIMLTFAFAGCGNSESSSVASTSSQAATTTTTAANSSEAEDKAENTATITIDVSDINNNYDKLDKSLQSEEFVPSNGEVVSTTAYEIKDGETAFDLLIQATTDKNIPIDYLTAEQSGYGSAYIKGINSIYEKSCGDNSGWCFEVNDKMPEVSSDAYELQAGDNVKFFYVCDYNTLFATDSTATSAAE